MAGVNTKGQQAGATFKRIREDKQLSQLDVARMSAKRFGPENTITTAQLSRIEGGKLDRVNIDDAVRIGQLYGMTPNEVATLYGLWDEKPGRQEPEAITEARQLAQSLPEDLREQLLQWVQFAVLTTRDQMLHRLRDQATASGDREMRLGPATPDDADEPPKSKRNSKK